MHRASGCTPTLLESLDDTHESINPEDEDDFRKLPHDLEALRQSSHGAKAESSLPQATSGVE